MNSIKINRALSQIKKSKSRSQQSKNQNNLYSTISHENQSSQKTEDYLCEWWVGNYTTRHYHNYELSSQKGPIDDHGFRVLFNYSYIVEAFSASYDRMLKGNFLKNLTPTKMSHQHYVCNMRVLCAMSHHQHIKSFTNNAATAIEQNLPTPMP
jgi:hypothetical protein